MSRFAGRLKRLVDSGRLAEVNLTAAALKVMWALSAHADRDGLVCMPQTMIAEKAGVERSTVQLAIQQLIEVDWVWLERPPAGRRPALYRIITDRHISRSTLAEPTVRARYDDEEGWIDSRSRPIPQAATSIPESVDDRHVGLLRAVDDRYVGQLLGESPRARTDTSPSELMTRSEATSHTRSRGASAERERPAGEAAQRETTLALRQQVNA